MRGLGRGSAGGAQPRIAQGPAHSGPEGAKCSGPGAGGRSAGTAGAPVFTPAPRPAGPRNRATPSGKKRGDGLERRPPVGTARRRRAKTRFLVYGRGGSVSGATTLRSEHDKGRYDGGAPPPGSKPLDESDWETEHRPSRRSGTESPARRDDEEIAAKLNEVLATEPRFGPGDRKNSGGKHRPRRVVAKLSLGDQPGQGRAGNRSRSATERERGLSSLPSTPG